jgi:phage-related minor tail protein
MLEGLLRYELQLQATALYAAARPGLTDMVGSVFGFGRPGIATSAINSSITSTGSINTLSLPGLQLDAQGGVYNAGLRTFAKGGMFTNSIVSSPTLFKFAQGAGLMGEAGPEAIMPLKRDSQGNLGVRSGNSGGNVDVVVNNFGSEKATTKETTDSRGNRKIEVIIGDMVASEVSRSGSPVQQSLSNSFNNRPALVRR